MRYLTGLGMWRAAKETCFHPNDDNLGNWQNHNTGSADLRVKVAGNEVNQIQW